MRIGITIVLGLLHFSTVAETAIIINNDTAEVSIAFCHIVLEDRNRRKDTHMRQFLEAIGSTWPLGESRIRVSVAETVPGNRQEITRILNLWNGTSQTNLENVAGKVEKNYPANNPTSCRNNPDNAQRFFRNARGHEATRNERRGVPFLWIHVIVIRSDHIPDEVSWRGERLTLEANAQLASNADVRADVLVVYETSGNDYYGGVAWNENDEKRHVGKYDVKRLAAELLNGVQHLLKLCPLEERRNCTESGNGRCQCEWTYRRAMTIEDASRFSHYCWNRARRTQNDLCGTTSPPAKKSTSSRSTDDPGVETTISTDEETATSPESTESPPDETTETGEATTVGTIATTTATSSMPPLVIVCIVAIVVIALIAVAVAVRQCVVYRRAVKAQQKKLEECGMVCSMKKRKRSLDTSTTSVSGASMTSAFPAVIGSRVT